MNKLLLALLLAILPFSHAIFPSVLCQSQQSLGSTMLSCLNSSVDAVFVKDGFCTTVACGPKSIQSPTFCLDSISLQNGIHSCINSSASADVYGNSTCMFVRCIRRSSTRPTNGSLVNGSNITNSTGLVNQIIALGSQYSSVLEGAATVLAALIGWHFTQRNNNRMKHYFTHIDATYAQYKADTETCEIELQKLKKSLIEDLKKGVLQESTYSILEKKIDDHLEEVRSAKNLSK